MKYYLFIFIIVLTNRLYSNDWMYFSLLDKINSCSSSYYFIIDKFNNKWFATSCGLVKFDNQSLTFYKDENNWTYIIPFSEYNGNIWSIIRKNLRGVGVAKLVSDKFEYFNTDNSDMTSNNISCIGIDSSGNTWLVNNPSIDDNIVVMQFNGVTFNFFTQSNSPFTIWNKVRKIVTTPDSTVWFATADGLISFKNNIWNKYNPENSGLISKYVEDIDFDSKGNIWIANNDGIVMFDGTKWSKYDSTNSPLPYDEYGGYYKISVDLNDRIWFRTANYLNYEICKMDSNGFTFFNKNNSPLNDIISIIDVDKFNNKWICTYSGYYIYREGGVILDSPEINKLLIRFGKVRFFV